MLQGEMLQGETLQGEMCQGETLYILQNSNIFSFHETPKYVYV